MKLIVTEVQSLSILAEWRVSSIDQFWWQRAYNGAVKLLCRFA